MLRSRLVRDVHALGRQYYIWYDVLHPLRPPRRQFQSEEMQMAASTQHDLGMQAGAIEYRLGARTLHLTNRIRSASGLCQHIDTFIGERLPHSILLRASHACKRSKDSA